MDSIIDTDWCLTCSKRTTGGRGYCSRECKMLDNDSFGFSSSSSEDNLSVHEHDAAQCRPSSSSSSHLSAYNSSSFVNEDALLNHQLEWPGYNEDGIRAWARAIPAGCGSPVAYRSPSRSRPNFPLSRQRPAQPTLCINATTRPALLNPSSRPTSPVDTRRPRCLPQAHGSASSLVSTITESIATPVSSKRRSAHVSPARERLSGKPCLLDGLASRFRAMVPSHSLPQHTTSSRKCSATAKEPRVVEATAEVHPSRTSNVWRRSDYGFTAHAKCEKISEDGFGFSTGSGALSDADLLYSLDGFEADKWVAPGCDKDLHFSRQSTGCWEMAGHNPDLLSSLHARQGMEENDAYLSRGRRITRC